MFNGGWKTKMLSQRQMSEIRREEAILRSIAKREGKKVVGFKHIQWSDGCVGVCPLYKE